MKLGVKKRRLESHPTSLAIAFLLLLIITINCSIPQVIGYTLVGRSICKGWTETGNPIVTNNFALTDEKVYLYFRFSWSNIQEYEQKWGSIPSIQQGLISAESMQESFEMKTFRISLTDPSQTNVGIPSPRTMHKVILDPPGCISSAFLEILDISGTTKNGRWKVSWYDGETHLFSEEFVVGEEKVDGKLAPEQTFLEKYGAGIGVIIVLAAAVAAVTLYAFRRRRKKKLTQAPAVSVPVPPPPMQSESVEGVSKPEKTMPKTEGMIYCIHCGQNLPSYAVYCRKCGKKIE